MGDSPGDSSSGSDGDASGAPHAAAAAAKGEATGSGSSRALSAASLPFCPGHQPLHPSQQPPIQFHPSQALFHHPSQPPFHHPSQPPFQHRQPPFLSSPTAPGQRFAAFGHQFAFNPAAALGSGSAFLSNRPVGTPAAASVSSGSGSGSRPLVQDLHGPSSSSPDLGRQSTPAQANSSREEVCSLRLPLRRRAYVPLISPRLGPRPVQTSSASAPKFSYVALAKHGSSTSEEMNKWKSKMLNFLKRDDCSHYKGQASTAGAIFEMQFNDILVKDKALAVLLCNAQGVNESWLHQAANDFFTESWLPTAGRASFLFKDMPTRLTAVSVVLKSKPLSKLISVCNKAMRIEAATVHGRQMLDTIICGFLDKLSKGESWRGDIKIEDLMLAEDAAGGKKLIITKESVVKENATDGERLDDLWALCLAVQPFYLVGDRLPLYFKELQKDLFYSTDLSDCFIEYLRYHPAFYASTP